MQSILRTFRSLALRPRRTGFPDTDAFFRFSEKICPTVAFHSFVGLQMNNASEFDHQANGAACPSLNLAGNGLSFQRVPLPSIFANAPETSNSSNRRVPSGDHAMEFTSAAPCPSTFSVLRRIRVAFDPSSIVATGPARPMASSLPCPRPSELQMQPTCRRARSLEGRITPFHLIPLHS